MRAELPEVGTVLATIGPFPVEWGKAKEVAQSLLARDAESRFTPGSPGPGPIVAPTYTMVQAHWGGALDNYPLLRLDMSRILDGEEEFDYRADVRVGDWLTGVARYVGVRESTGRRAGAVRMITIETTFTNQTGAVVVVVRRTEVEFDHAPDWGSN
jgi:hypothetical protein